ncbi:hypothetical protein CPB85DRAFT_1253675 [Mucidula mucida]|nr:hypothetical protein CPB85DRAFT_1253675 [Mucidula mucida]
MSLRKREALARVDSELIAKEGVEADFARGGVGGQVGGRHSGQGGHEIQKHENEERIGTFRSMHSQSIPFQNPTPTLKTGSAGCQSGVSQSRAQPPEVQRLNCGG